MMFLSRALARYGACTLAAIFLTTVAQAQTAPTAANETADTAASAAVTINLKTGSTGAPTSAAIVNGPTNGTITVVAGTNVTYTPNACTKGTDSFTFTLSNAAGTSAPATATVTVTPEAAASPGLYFVDPYLVAALDNGGDLKTLGLASLYTKQNWSAVQAYALDADNTSAAIAVVVTGNCTADVVLSTTNGTTLTPYESGFLNKVPTATKATTLGIPASQLIKFGGKYYAAVLVQSPVAGDTFDTSTPITVTAQQRGGVISAKLALDVPPVVLVHGLWGDATSLQDLQQYLLTTPQWKKTGLVDAICYSLYLGFDAASDPLSASGDSCEVTSKTALDQEIAHLMATLDNKHVVGSRVDIVAHSMGGLVARHYSAQSEYRGLRNRNMGVFHQVVTLDTPELGSKLATYLIDNASATLQAPEFSGAWNLWEAECDSSDTVRTCFNKLGLPLAASGQPLTTGAVYSLIPNGPSLTAAPDSRIPNALWRAVTATWPQTDKASSLLRSVLNTLVQATYSNTSKAPGTSSILGTLNNDVIVTTVSQLGDSQGSYNFTDLAHTKTPDPSVLGVFFDGGNQNVEEDDSVDNVVGCWLANFGQVCKPAFVATADVHKAATTTTATPKFAAFNRLKMDTPAQTAQVGVPFELPLHFASPVARTVFVSQNDGHGEIAAGSGQAVVTRSAAGVDYIQVTPQRIGTMTFKVAASFADGGVAVQQVSLNVRAPSAAPTAFSADKSPVVIVLDNTEAVAMLHPQATYPGAGTIPLNPHLVKTTVQQSQAVISVDGGLIHALKPGKATIDASFGGKTAEVQVVVKPKWE